MSVDVIRRNSAPLEPQPTNVVPRLTKADGVRAVLFDVYGTLFVSASGDIGLTRGTSRGAAAAAALAAAGVALHVDNADEMVSELHAEVTRQHAATDADYPEVDIHEVWKRTLERLLRDSDEEFTLDDAQLARLAIEYETRVNPVWPMPGLNECLKAIRDAGLTLGIVSNAQAFTRELFPALTGSTAAELGFSNDLCIWSYEYLQAKPGKYLFEQAVAVLARRGIDPAEVLYVGNDMRNDVAPAAAVGFRTVLFAGDARSLRLRTGDPLVSGVEPDGVVADLRQILGILCLAPLPE